MKKIILAILFVSGVLADVLQIRDFSTDIYSKTAPNATKKISLDLEVIGRDMDENEPYVLDALNIIVGSFYVEDLLTSKGKEKLKSEFMKYANKKHATDIENVLIMGLKVVENLSLDKVIAAIKDRNLCSNNPSSKKGDAGFANEIIISPTNANQKPIDLNTIKEFGKDFE